MTDFSFYALSYVLLLISCLLLASAFHNKDGTKVEFRVWIPFRSKLAAAILGGVNNIWNVSVFSR